MKKVLIMSLAMMSLAGTLYAGSSCSKKDKDCGEKEKECSSTEKTESKAGSCTAKKK